MIEINSNEGLMTWLMNRLNQKWGGKAILKGGMVLRLLDCPRTTNDLDYVFVPFQSKKEILPLIEKVIKELDGAKFSASFHSTSLRVAIFYKNFQTQIEANVERKCKTSPLSTASIARKYNMLPEIISTMSLDWALANKMAAWNEQGLMRDLYDIYFIGSVLEILPDKNMLKKRLSKINYLVKGKRINTNKSMTIAAFLEKLNLSLQNLTINDLENELRDSLDPKEIPGLDYKIKIGIKKLIEKISLDSKND